VSLTSVATPLPAAPSAWLSDEPPGGSPGGGSDGGSDSSAKVAGSPGGESSSDSGGSGDDAPKVEHSEPAKSADSGSGAEGPAPEVKTAKPDDGGQQGEPASGPTVVSKDAGQAGSTDQNGSGPTVTAQPPGQAEQSAGSNSAAQPPGQTEPEVSGLTLAPGTGPQSAQSDSDLSPVIHRNAPSDELPASDPNSALVSRYRAPTEPGQAETDLSPLKKTNPNDWSAFPPSGKDYGWNTAGALVTANGSVVKDVNGQADTLKEIEKYRADQRVYQEVAGSAPDRITREAFEGKAALAEKGAASELAKLQTTNAIRQGADNIGDPAWVEQQLGKARGSIANGGVNTAVAAGQAGESLSTLGPAGAKVGEQVTDAGVAVGQKAIAAGQGLEAPAKAVAPGLGKVGGTAVDALEWAGKRAGSVGTVLNLAQGASDIVFEGKSVGRVASETTGSVAGGAVGTWVGGAIGSAIPIPVVGTAAGAAVGNFVGSYLGGKLGDLFADETMGEGK
jgi:hypothetical protein